MGPNTSLEAGLNRIAAEVEAEYPKMLEARRAKADELREMDDQLRKAERVLRVLRPEIYGQPAGRPKGSKKKAKAQTVSSERREIIVAAITELLSEQEEVRQADVVRKTGLRSGPVSLVFKELKDEDTLRLVRVDKTTGSRYFKYTRRVSLNGTKV